MERISLVGSVCGVVQAGLGYFLGGIGGDVDLGALGHKFLQIFEQKHRGR